MSDIPAVGSSWSRSRWIGMIAFVLGVEFLLVFGLSEHRSSASRAVPAKPVITLILNPEVDVRLQHLEGVRDSTLFALVNQHGFSGDAWLKTTPREFHAAEWNEPPQLLGADVNQLGFVPAGARSTITTAAPIITGKSVPHLRAKSVPLLPLTRQTTLTREGDLARRSIKLAPPLPALPAADVLLPTTIEVMVNREGDLISARLISGPGVKSAAQKLADLRALELARAIRFESVTVADEIARSGKPGLAWGRIIFHWHTIEPAGAKP